MTQTIAIKKGDFLILRGGKEVGLTARGRVMQSPIDQLVRFLPPNRYFDLRMRHIAGPLAGVEVQFSLALARKAKITNTCVCDAYPYPHRKGKGQCNGKG